MAEYGYIWNPAYLGQMTTPQRKTPEYALRTIEQKAYLRKPLEIARRGGLLDEELQPTNALCQNGKPNHRALVYLVIRIYRYLNRGKPKETRYTHEFSLFMRLWNGRNYSQTAQRVGKNRKRPTDTERLIDNVFEQVRYT